MFVEVLLLLAVFTVSTVAQYIGFDQLAPFFQAFDWKRKNEWVGRINGSVAQIFIVLFALASGGATQWGAALVMAYFMHDVAHCALYDHGITNYIHHIVGFLVVVLQQTVMTPEQSYSTFLAGVSLEATSPFVSGTWMMRAAGYKDHPAFKYVAGFTLVFFGIMRLLVFPWIMANHMDRVTASVFSPLLGLNVYWFYKMLRMAEKAFATKSGDERLE